MPDCCFYCSVIYFNNNIKNIQPSDFDLVISDEAHRSLGEKVEEFLNTSLDLN